MALLAAAHSFLSRHAPAAPGGDSGEADHEIDAKLEADAKPEAQAPPPPLGIRFASGRLIELSGEHACARSTLAVAAVLAAQQAGEPVAWLQPAGGVLYPPDLAESGVDLAALVVIHVPATAGPFGLPRAAEYLLRSGGYGLLVLDWSHCDLPLAASPAASPAASSQHHRTHQHQHQHHQHHHHAPSRRGDDSRSTQTAHGVAWQGRLLSLARAHACCVLLLTHKSQHQGSLGPLISLRIEPQRIRAGPGRFALDNRILKNKAGFAGELRLFAGEAHLDERRGPWGVI